jgi:predicted dehydrogenase
VPERARIALIGAGWWGTQVYVPALLADPRAELVAVTRTDREGLDRLASTFGVNGYTDHHAMLAAERPDGVIVSSPHPAHFENAMAALGQGAHLLVDKPMTTSAADARALVAEASQREREIVVAYGWNFKDFAVRAAELVQAGEIGEVRHAALQMASPTEDLFAGEGLVETEGHMFRPPPSTWADPAAAGGYGWGQLSHALGLLFAVVPLAPAEVFAVAGLSPAGVDAFDALALRLANGATASVSGAATVPKHCGYQLDLRVFGTEGMLLLDIERQRMEVRRKDRRDTVLDLPPGAGAYAAEPAVARLVDLCLGTAARNEAPGLVGQRAVEVLDAMHRSLASGRAERV